MGWGRCFPGTKIVRGGDRSRIPSCRRSASLETHPQLAGRPGLVALQSSRGHANAPSAAPLLATQTVPHRPALRPTIHPPPPRVHHIPDRRDPGRGLRRLPHLRSSQQYPAPLTRRSPTRHTPHRRKALSVRCVDRAPPRKGIRDQCSSQYRTRAGARSGPRTLCRVPFEYSTLGAYVCGTSQVGTFSWNAPSLSSRPPDDRRPPASPTLDPTSCSPRGPGSYRGPERLGMVQRPVQRPVNAILDTSAYPIQDGVSVALGGLVVALELVIHKFGGRCYSIWCMCMAWSTCMSSLLRSRHLRYSGIAEN